MGPLLPSRAYGVPIRTGVVQALERLDNSCVLHLTAPNVPQVRLVVKPDALTSVGGYAVLERVRSAGHAVLLSSWCDSAGCLPPAAISAALGSLVCLLVVSLH